MAQTQVGIKLTLDGAQQVEQGVRRVVDSVGSIGSATSASARQAIDATSSLKSAFASLGGDLKSQLAGTIGAFSGLAAAIGGLNKVVAVQRQFDVLNSSLITMTGSVKDAAVAFGALQDFAVKTPYSLAETVGAFTKLKALGLDPTERAMTSFGNTAAAMGKSLTQFIEAVADASTGEFERLKEFGIKASKEGSNVALTFQGVTTTVKNNADAITEYLTKLGETEFAGAMATRAATLDGAISALGDTWDNLFLTISQKNTGGLMYDSVQLAAAAIQSLTKIVEAMSDAADSNARSTGAMAAVQNGITTVFETVAVVGANVAYVLKATGIELGGLAAQAAAVARLDFKGAALIGDEMTRDAAANRAAVDALTASILNAKNQTKEAGKTLDDLVKPRPKAKPPIDEDAIKAAKKALQEIEKEAAKGLELYNNLIAETAGFQGDYAEKVSQLAEAYAKNKISLEGFTFAHEKLLKKQPAAVEATKAEAEARKVLADAVIASARAYEEAQQAMDALQADTWQMVNDTVKASTDSAAAVQFELGLIGQTTEARRIAIEQRKIELALEEKIKKVKATPFEGGEEAQLREINRLREAAAQDSATAISRIQLDEAAKSVEQYDKIFREGFAALIAGGKDSWKSFTKSLTTTFKTAVVDQIYKAFAQPFVVKVVVSMMGIAGLNGAAQAAGLGGEGGVGIGDVASGISMARTAMSGTQWLTDFGGSVSNSINQIGGKLFDAGFEEFGGSLVDWTNTAGSSIAEFAKVAGDAIGYLNSFRLTADGRWGAAIGSAAGTYFGGPIGSFIGSTIGGLLDDLFSGGAGTPHMGGVAKYSAGSGLQTGTDGRGEFGTTFGGVDYNKSGTDFASGMAMELTRLLDDMATTFGKKAGYEVITAFADDSSGDGAWGALKINLGGDSVLNWDDTRTSRWAPKEFADGEKGVEEYNKAIAADVKKYLISQAPEWAKTVFKGLGDAPTLDQLGKAAQSVGTLHKVLGAMGENVLPSLADASDSAITALVKAAGGTDALTASMVNYYNSTATDLDRQQYAFKGLNTALTGLTRTETRTGTVRQPVASSWDGLKYATMNVHQYQYQEKVSDLKLPDADVSLKKWYDGLVEAASALDLTAEGNAEYLTSLLALSPAVDALAEAWDASLEGIFGSTTLGALANAALRGDAFATAVINAAGGLEAFGEAITGYYEHFYSEGERAAMTTAQITKELAKVGVEMPKTREEFRALMDASVAMGEAGQPVVNALLEVQGAFASVTPPLADAAAAVETVEQAYARLTTATRTAEDVANERISLEERLFNATATAAQIAEKARNAIDPLNQSLYDTVLAAERLKAATETLPDALESSLGRAPAQEELDYWIGQVSSGVMTLQDALKGIAEGGVTEKLTLRIKELEDAEGYLTEVRDRELSLLSPTNQALQKRIWALEDEKKATEEAAAKAKTIADQRLGLEGQLLTLQGNTAELRRRELALLDPSNQALQKRIWALEDLKAAEDAYNTALSERDNAQSAVDRVLGEATNAYLNAVQQQASAAQRVADLHRQAAEKMLSAGKSLREFVSGEMVSGADQVTSQRVAQSEFSTLLGRANAGDTEAYGQLSDAARTLLDKSRQVMGQDEFDRVRASVLRSLQSAADAADAAAAASSAKAGAAQPDPMTEALSALQSADTALAEALRVATTIGAPLVETKRDLVAEYRKAMDTLVQAENKLANALEALNEIKKNTGNTVTAIGDLKFKIEAINLDASTTIDFILGSDLPADLKELALGGPRTVQATVDYLLGNLESIPKPLMDVVLGTLTQFDVTTNFLVGSALPDDLKRLALTASDRVIQNTYDYLTGTTLTDELKQLAVLNSGTISRTINFVAESTELTDAQKKVAFNTLGDYTTTVKAVLDSTMSDSIKKVVLDGVGVYEASVKAAAASDLPASLKKVLFDGAGDYLTTIKSTLDSSLTDAQKALLLNANSSAQRVINMSVTGGSLNDEQKTFLNTAAGTISRALALTASGGSLTAEQSNFLGYAAATVSRVLSLSASGGSLTADQQAILKAVGGTTSSSVTATVNGTVGWTNTTVETYLQDIKYNTGKLATDIYAAYTSVTGLKLPNTSVHEALKAVSSSSAAVKAGVYAQLRLGGYTDSLIRAVADNVLDGKQTDTDWNALKKLAGYASGGYTGPGGMYEPAGIVHKGEVVWSQTDIARAGGVAVVEAMRKGLRGYADGGAVATPAYTPPTYTPPIAVRQGGSDTTALERRMDAVVQELREVRRESARQIRILEQQLMEQTRMASDVRGVRNSGVQVYTDPAEPLDIKPTEAVPA